ncbi:hypothetical protein ACFYWP_00060 [Actinacidiphila glaucinigra]|uniref:hypothetical protein n=1 Tax=Actinacidiphila glaucinigra TaxID=235986 RepID=UPI0036CC7479
MGAELEVLASTAATTLIGLMATDAWQQARSTINRVWRKSRPEQADRVNADLDEAQLTVTQARRNDDDALEAAVLAEWQSRMLRLALTDSAVRADLKAAVRQLEALARKTAPGSVSMQADARDHARIYQSAQDMVINE